MSFDTKYPHRKDWRKPYYGEAEIDVRHRARGIFATARQHHKTQKQHLIEADLLSDADAHDEWLLGVIEELDVEYFVERLTHEI
jgi:hypothetical protein